MQLKPTTRELIVFAVTAVGLLLAYHWVFSSYFPTANGGVGYDYNYILPNLLDGYYWYLNNGAFSTPWFTAAFCGGVPAFPHPHNLYYSLPQWLTFGTDPLHAVYLTMLCFALIGFGGFYLLLRRCFHTSQATALLGAALFMFNGFFASRLLVGHINFHAFMLAPLIAWLLLYQDNSRFQPLRSLFVKIVAAGLLFGYVIYAGGAQVILPMVMVVLIIGIIHGLLHGGQALFWVKLSGSGVIGIAVALAKLTAALAFLANFGRNDYLLPGADSIWGLLQLIFEDLFLQPSGETVSTVLTNVQWPLQRHEFEYGITIIPLLVLLTAAVFRFRSGISKPRIHSAQWLQLGTLALLLLIPLVLNYYTPSWNAVLKEMPVIRNSSLMIRWFCIYIPVIILCAALLFDKTAAIKKFRPYLAAAGILAVVLINLYTDRDYYANQPYNPTPITDAYNEAQSKGKPVNIDAITVFKDEKGRIAMPVYRNNTLVNGRSQLACYEAIFGYRLEHFPVKKLRPGPVHQILDGDLNLKNPACYVFADANSCAPGDHFTIRQAEAAKALTRYRPYEFNLPSRQRAANTVSVVTLVAAVLFLILYPLLLLWRKQSRNGSSERR